MENTAKIITDAAAVSEEKIKNDEEYKKLELQKNEIINKLRQKLPDEDYQELEKLIDCFEGQLFITTMGFSFVSVLDLDKIS